MKNEEINKKFNEIQLLRKNNKNVDKEIDDLITSCENLIKATINKIIKENGGQYDDKDLDLLQEGSLGLYNAINTYNPEKDVTFTTYAGVCIKNKILDYIRKESVFKKNIGYQKNNKDADSDEYDLLGNIKDPSKTPEEELIEKEEELIKKDKLENIMSNLNDTEKEILRLYIQFNSYDEIAKKLNITSKKVDNTIQKIKKYYKKKI